MSFDDQRRDVLGPTRSERLLADTDVRRLLGPSKGSSLQNLKALDEAEPCPRCNGRGSSSFTGTCPHCGGSGKLAGYRKRNSLTSR